MADWPEDTDRDPSEEDRARRDQSTGLVADLRQQLQQGQITQERYEERMNDLLQQEQDVKRERELERELPPGEAEDMEEQA